MPSRSPLVWRAGELATAAGGEVVSGNASVVVEGVSIDSRRVSSGELFVAIQGERFDGHEFAADAIRNGAVALVVSDTTAVGMPDVVVGDDSPCVIAVPDTTRALQLLGRFVRRQSAAQVVAITGSVGKTTTKELTAALLACRYDVFRNEGNLNNHIGLPLSLLELRRRPEVAVVELGMNHAGEIRTLVEIAEPETRVWTNVAEVHAEFFDSVDAIADAKAEILEGATASTHVVVNADDERVMARVAGFPGQLTTFGVEAPADVRATGLRRLGLEGMEATVHTPLGSNVMRTPLLGDGNVANILAAIAVALRFQVPLDAVWARVSTFGPPRRRGQVMHLGSVTLVDDSYNSNPLALDRALTAVGAHESSGRRVAVLGEMLELGERADALHRRCGQTVVTTGFDLLVVVGERAAHALADGAVEAGLAAGSVSRFKTSDEAATYLTEIVRPGDVVLVKGSRGVGLDRVVDRLQTELG